MLKDILWSLDATLHGLILHEQFFPERKTLFTNILYPTPKKNRVLELS